MKWWTMLITMIQNDIKAMRSRRLIQTGETSELAVNGVLDMVADDAIKDCKIGNNHE